MRPVNKPVPSVVQNPGTIKSSQLGGGLLATLGRYCSFCERSLQEDPVLLLNKRSEKTNLSYSDWPDLLLSCPDCSASAQAAFLNKANFKASGQSLWPDDSSYTLTLDNNMSHNTSGPFQYRLQSVNIVSIGERGARTSLPAQDQVIISVNTESPLRDKALNTIKLFMLNTRYYDDTTNTMTIPFPDYTQIDDQRVQERTAIWQLAVAASQRLQRAVAYPIPYAMLQEQIADTARAAGFWSVWMTVFWQTFGDTNLLEATFIETTKKNDFVFYGFEQNFETGPFLFFPGTDKTRISYVTVEQAG